MPPSKRENMTPRTQASGSRPQPNELESQRFKAHKGWPWSDDTRWSGDLPVAERAVPNDTK